MKRLQHLVIVESPTKGRTIERFLGPGYVVAASFGHVRDLPKSELGVDETSLEPRYVIPPKARKTIKLLKDLMTGATDIFIATDLDREGEAIGWHIMQAVAISRPSNPSKPILRIVFHEITKSAIDEALKHPRGLNLDLVDAQQARRILDRLVGYKLSPLLWKKVARGLSAGRVQSVAVRLIVDRERECLQFKPQEFWTVEVELEKDHTAFIATLSARDGQRLDKLALKTTQEAEKIIALLGGADYKVVDRKESTTKRSPYPPFTTSTLQQEAARQFGWSAAQTMRVAQSIYEQGYITYHRTDSVNVAWSAIGSARKVIEQSYGSRYLPKIGRQYKTKTRGAQEAHEAIRPAYPDRLPEAIDIVDARERKLYTLVWQRLIASQMNPAVFEETTVDIAAKNFTFRAWGTTLTFDGFLKVWPMKLELKRLPPLSPGDLLRLRQLLKTQHFTEPPPRYNMASIVKTLEEYGIGRPSTYAPIISTIIGRRYVTSERGVFTPTELGTLVTDLLVEHFPEIVDTSFTATMEENLDAIAEGKRSWKGVVEDFYRPFAVKLEQKQEEIKKSDYEEVLPEKCPESGHPLVVKMGRYGKFIACSGFPACKYTRPLVVELNLVCPQCGQGKVVERKTRRGATFWGCSRYPDCRWATWKRPPASTVASSTPQTPNPT